jgi:predicted nucleotidyltransferase
MNHHTNKVRIKAVANALGDLKEKVVFVGGATISLYPDRPVFEVRPTDDVDVIVEIINYTGRAKLEEKLRSIGFSHDMESGVVCRFKIHGITVDIMPTDDPSIGFKNIWYPKGFKNAISHQIDERCTVKILSPAYFIATKLEAFKGRGKSDGRLSTDFEDMIYIFENREAIWTEMKNADSDLKRYLQKEIQELLRNLNLSDWIDGHVERGSPPATDSIINQLNSFIQ